MPRALLSVHDKSGIAALAARLVELGWSIVASGGTAAHLRDAGIESTDTTDVTGDQDWAPHTLRRMYRLRARLGWLLRCDRAEGMSLSGHRAPVLRPTRAARAPPGAVNRPKSP